MLYLIFSSFATSFKLIVSILLTPHKILDFAGAPFSFAASGMNPAAAKVLPAAKRLHAPQARMLYLIFSSFATSFKLIVSILLTPFSCMVTP